MTLKQLKDHIAAIEKAGGDDNTYIRLHVSDDSGGWDVACTRDEDDGSFWALEQLSHGGASRKMSMLTFYLVLDESHLIPQGDF